MADFRHLLADLAGVVFLMILIGLMLGLTAAAIREVWKRRGRA